MLLDTASLNRNKNGLKKALDKTITRINRQGKIETGKQEKKSINSIDVCDCRWTVSTIRATFPPRLCTAAIRLLVRKGTQRHQTTTKLRTAKRMVVVVVHDEEIETHKKNYKRLCLRVPVLRDA